MGRIRSGKALGRGLWAVGLIWGAAGLVRWPGETADAVRAGLSLCADALLPALFPFLVVSSLTVSLGLAGGLGRAQAPAMALFRLPGACAAPLLLGVVGGYPVGARAAVELYRGGQCGRGECERLLAFCNNCGPAFLLGVAGRGLFGDVRAGLLLWGIHLAAALAVGLLLAPLGRRGRRGERRDLPIRAERPAAAFTGAVRGAGNAALSLCAFVVTFAVLLRLMTLWGLLPALARLLSALPLGLTGEGAERLLTGLVELSSGVKSLAGEGSLRARWILAALLLGWGGVSVHCQTISLLEGTDLSPRLYLTGKALQGLLSAALALSAFRLLPPVRDAWAGTARGAAGSPLLRGGPLLLVSALLAGGLFFFLVWMGVKTAGKREKSVVK